MLIVDASVAIKWFIEQKGAQQARALAGPEATLIAPDLILAEIANAFWKYVRARKLAIEDARLMLARAPVAFTRLAPLWEVIGEALDLAATLDHPVYDCCYIVLARREAAPLAAADKRLAHTAQAYGIETRQIG